MAIKRGDPTLEEAAEQGFSCAALSVVGSYRPHYFVGAVQYNEAQEGFPIARDERRADWNIRCEVPGRLRELKFKLAANNRSRSSQKLATPRLDAISIARGSVEPDCDFAGISTIVSERARDVLSPAVEDECTFVEVECIGVGGRWFVMWIRNLIDVVDESASDISTWGWREGGEELLKPRRLAFNERLLAVNHLFRLPLWRYIHDHDLCVPAFRELVKRHHLQGFSFISAGGTGPFIAD